MADVVITIKLKLDWHDRMVFDRELSSIGFRVGYAIGWHINRYSGQTHVGRHTIAEKIGCCVKSVDRAITELERRGHLVVEHNRGRGRSNLFRMGQPENATHKSPFPAQNETGSSPFPSPKNATDEVQKGDRNDDKRGHGCRPNPYIEPIESYPSPSPSPSFSDSRRRFPQSERTADGKRGAYEIELAKRLGNGNVATGWEFVSRLTENEVTSLVRRLRNGGLRDRDLAWVRLNLSAKVAR
jgi:hypothetical protein